MIHKGFSVYSSEFLSEKPVIHILKKVRNYLNTATDTLLAMRNYISLIQKENNNQ